MGDDTSQYVMRVCPSCQTRVLGSGSAGSMGRVVCPECGESVDAGEKVSETPAESCDNVEQGAGKPAEGVERPCAETPNEPVPSPADSHAPGSEVDPEAFQETTTVEEEAPDRKVDGQPCVPTPEGAAPASRERGGPGDAELRETAEAPAGTTDSIEMSRFIDGGVEPSPRAAEEAERMSSEVSSEFSRPVPELVEVGGDASVPPPEPLDNETSAEGSEPVEIRELEAPMALSSSEIRRLLADGTYRLQVGDAVYGPSGVDEMVPLVKHGLLGAADAVSRDGGPWRPVTEHPALEELRERCGEGIREHLGGSGAQTDDVGSVNLDGEGIRRDDIRADAAANTGREMEPQGGGGESGSDGSGGVSVVGGLTALAMVVALVGLGVVGATGTSTFTQPFRAVAGGSGNDGDESAAGAIPSGRRDEPAPIGQAVEAANREIGLAVEIDVSDPERQLRVARRLADAGRPLEAVGIYEVVWSERRDDAGIAKEYVDTAMAAGRYRRAREIAVEAMQSFSETAAFEERFQRAIDRDPTLNEREPVALDDGSVRRLRPAVDRDVEGLLAEGPDGEIVSLFEPYDGSEREWRDDIAAWRLCHMIGCQFAIPRTRPARISRESFRRMFDGEPGTWRGAELVWRERQGPEGERREYLYGSLREWPGDVVRWPLTARSVWDDWVSITESPPSWEAPITEHLDGLEEVDGGAPHAALLERARGMEVRCAAAQISDMFVFDYLTNNWNRITPDESGAYNHFGDDGFVTLRTDTAIQRRRSKRVRGRFRWVSRFDRDTVTALRALDAEKLGRLLYPDPSALEEAKVDILLEQRRRLLQRVDRLVAEHGTEAVFPFE